MLLRLNNASVVNIPMDEFYMHPFKYNTFKQNKWNLEELTSGVRVIVTEGDS